MLTCDQYHMPTTLSEALALLRAAPEGSRLVAGATDILPWAREGRAGNVHLPAMIDLSRVGELSGYTIADGRVRLGANVVYQQFLTDDTLRRHLPCMPFCSVWFADDQIREQATLAGNVVNASPAADSVPAMVAAGAVARIAGPDGVRDLAVIDVPQGPGKTALARGEFIASILLPARGARSGDAYLRFIPRTEMDIAVVGCGVSLGLDEEDRVTAARVALGAVGPKVMLVEEAAQAITGRVLDAAALDGLFDLAKARPVSRLGYLDYGLPPEIVSIPRPTGD